MVTFSIFALVSAIIAFMLPETKETKLLQTLTEANEFYENNNKRKHCTK